MRYTETPEPRAKCTMCAEGGTTSDSRRRFSGGVIEHGAFAGVQNAGVCELAGVCGGILLSVAIRLSQSGLRSSMLSRACAGVGGVEVDGFGSHGAALAPAAVAIQRLVGSSAAAWA